MNRSILFRLVPLAVSAALPFAAAAQNLDPTVVVDRNYEGKLMEVHKPSLKMQIPDSVTRFDLDFDYSVFDNPYKGSYEFSPYTVKMHPASSALAPKKLYLRAGAGYPLRPVFDLVWSPSFKKGFRIDVYALHRSYVGNYRSFGPSAEPQSGTVKIDRWRSDDGSVRTWSGYDFSTRAGLDGSYDWKKGTAVFDVSYFGLASDDRQRRRGYDALDVKAGVCSVPSDGPHFLYDVTASYRFANDKAKYRAGNSYVLDEHLFGADASLGWAFAGGHRMLFDFALDVAAYSGCTDAAAGNFRIIPHYMFVKGRWNLDLGLRLSMIASQADAVGMFASRDQIVYPDVTVSFAAIPDAMSLYAKATGGSSLNTYARILEENRHADLAFARGRGVVLDNTVERLSAMIGMEGRIGMQFSYDLRAGYSNYGNAMLDAVALEAEPQDGSLKYLPGLGYSSYRKCFAQAELCWKNESIRLDGHVNYAHVWGLDSASGLFAPASLTGDVAFEYNWNRRIFAGVDCAFSTARRGGLLYPSGELYGAVLPGYADLGLSLEVALTRSFSLWARGENLLNMTVQRNPLYAEQGIGFTLGISLNL
mgnify:FL=1